MGGGAAAMGGGVARTGAAQQRVPSAGVMATPLTRGGVTMVVLVADAVAAVARDGSSDAIRLAWWLCDGGRGGR
ncbi:methyltransferase domain-containing protein [Sesbania bispinosa]|nr:methyltransferase domain-containing protein [Sesbania bispinosa]